MGPVTPLLVLAEDLRDRYDFVFVGTYRGVERSVVEGVSYLSYRPLLSGKWRRYFSLANLLDVFKIVIAFFQSFYILLKERPVLVISAGAYVSVPLAWSAYFLRIPVLIHQQDVRSGLANRLMARAAQIITVTFEKSLADYGSRALWVGNPCRQMPAGDLAKIVEAFQLKEDRPLLLALGGGTGSKSLNRLVSSSLSELSSVCQIVHITGRDKQTGQSLGDNYQVYEFLSHDKLLALISRADLVVSRAGLGILTELAHFAKPVILVPMPGSHQEDNAEFFKDQGAALVLNKDDLNPERFSSLVAKVLADQSLRDDLSKNIKTVLPKGAEESLRMIIITLIEKTS